MNTSIRERERERKKKMSTTTTTTTGLIELGLGSITTINSFSDFPSPPQFSNAGGAVFLSMQCVTEIETNNLPTGEDSLVDFLGIFFQTYFPSEQQRLGVYVFNFDSPNDRSQIALILQNQLSASFVLEPTNPSSVPSYALTIQDLNTSEGFVLNGLHNSFDARNNNFYIDNISAPVTIEYDVSNLGQGLSLDTYINEYFIKDVENTTLLAAMSVLIHDKGGWLGSRLAHFKLKQDLNLSLFKNIYFDASLANDVHFEAPLNKKLNISTFDMNPSFNHSIYLDGAITLCVEREFYQRNGDNRVVVSSGCTFILFKKSSMLHYSNQGKIIVQKDANFIFVQII